MPRDYKNVKKKTEQKKPVIGHILSFVTGLSVGLFVALGVYIESQLPDVEEPDLKIEEEPSEKNKEKLLPPVPKFDFYKILPNKKVNISEWVAEEKENDSGSTPAQQGIYILQIGSFNTNKAADQIKAKLALLGFSADIQRVVINGQDIRHRVRIGPYKDIEKLKEARKRLLDNDMESMLLKLKVEDIGQ